MFGKKKKEVLEEILKLDKKKIEKKKIEAEIRCLENDLILKDMNIIRKIFFGLIVIFVEVFDTIINYFIKKIPFQSIYFKKKNFFLKTDFYINGVEPLMEYYMEIIDEMDDSKFTWYIIAIFTLTIPFIYFFPIVFISTTLKIASLIIAKILSSITILLSKLYINKLMRFTPIKQFILLQNSVIEKYCYPDIKINSIFNNIKIFIKNIFSYLFMDYVNTYEGSTTKITSDYINKSDIIEKKRNLEVMYEGKKKKKYIIIVNILSQLIKKKKLHS